MLFHMQRDVIGLCGEILAAVGTFPDIKLGEEEILSFIS